MTTELASAEVRTRKPGVAAVAWQLAEIRWATLSTALFVLGGVGMLAGAPSWFSWTVLLACCAAGDSAGRAWPGCARCAEARSMSTC